MLKRAQQKYQGKPLIVCQSEGEEMVPVRVLGRGVELVPKYPNSVENQRRWGDKLSSGTIKIKTHRGVRVKKL